MAGLLDALWPYIPPGFREGLFGGNDYAQTQPSPGLPPQPVQQRSGLIGALAELTPGADVRDAVNFSRSSVDNMRQGAVAQGLLDMAYVPAALAGVVLPGSASGYRQAGGAVSDALEDTVRKTQDYRISHRPMTVDGGAARIDDLTPAFGDDIYGPNAQQFFGSGGYDAAERRILKLLADLRGKPDQVVTIYRGVPEDVTAISPGDWVTLDREIAQEYGPKVISQNVPARFVTGWPDSLFEFGYHPE